MIYRKCGNSGLKLPIISLGLWHNFGNADSFSNAKKMIYTAFDNGITHFDIANNYGPPPGSAEKNFGRILKSGFKKHRDEIIVSSKAGYHMWEGPYGEWGSKKHIISSLDQSLKRTGLEYFDIFYSHRFDPETSLEETMGALDYAVRQGKALYAGISNYTPEKTIQAASVLKRTGTPCLIHQTSYSMLNRKPESGLLNVLKKEKIGCIAFSPLAQGLLTDKYLHGIKAGSRASKSHGFLKPEHITENKISLIKKLNEFAKTRNQNLAQLALVWVLRKDIITSVLIGASYSKQILENIKILKNQTLTLDEEQKIEEFLNDI
jgi:L-glyceraldehyde 3-phosphate reductase